MCFSLTGLGCSCLHSILRAALDPSKDFFFYPSSQPGQVSVAYHPRAFTDLDTSLTLSCFLACLLGIIQHISYFLEEYGLQADVIPYSPGFIPIYLCFFSIFLFCFLLSLPCQCSSHPKPEFSIFSVQSFPVVKRMGSVAKMHWSKFQTCSLLAV